VLLVDQETSLVLVVVVVAVFVVVYLSRSAGGMIHQPALVQLLPCST
jgi:hypothetical protein